mmetsp:Transcript_6309/g.13170  ORF Transcript_6309/g.13170 Transcript_6309/m.13170 type:complete len:95 (-) Transcript_6309:225-509(-)
MKTISIWGEGVAGKVHLEIESIGAVGCSPGVAGPKATVALLGLNEWSVTSIPVIPPSLWTVLVVAVAILGFFWTKRQRRNHTDYEDLSKISVEV